MKKRVTLLLIAVGLFIGYIVPEVENVLAIESRSINKIPSFEHFTKYPDHTASYTCNPDIWGNNQDVCSIVLPKMEARNVNLGSGNTFYFFVNKEFYQAYNILLEQRTLDNPKAKDFYQMAIYNDQHIYAYVTEGELTSADAIEWQYSSQSDVYYFKLENFLGDSVTIWSAYDPVWDYSSFKWQIQTSPSFEGFVDYTPYSDPLEVDSGATVTDIYLDKDTVLLGENYNINIIVDNPNQFKFHSVVIDGDEFKVNDGQSTNEIGDEYKLEIPMTSSVEYGDIIHSIDKLILTAENVNSDYDIIDINQTVTLSSIQSFTSEITIDKVGFINDNINLGDDNILEINLSNPLNIDVDSLIINDIIYKDFILERKNLESNFEEIDRDVIGVQTGVITEEQRLAIEGFMNNPDNVTLHGTSDYWIMKDPSDVYYLYTNQSGFIDHYISNKVMYIEDGEKIYRYTIENFNDVENISFVLVDSIVNAAYDTNYSELEVGTKIIYSTVEVRLSYDYGTYGTGVKSPSYWYDPVSQKVVLKLPYGYKEGNIDYNVRSLCFKKEDNSKLYYDEMAINTILTVNFLNPIYTNDIVIDSFTLDKDKAFNNEVITGTINITNPNELNLDSFYINNVLVDVFTFSSDKREVNFELDTSEYYFVGISELNVTKMIFEGVYNSITIENDLVPDNVKTGVTLVNSDFAKNVSIDRFILDQSYYLYGTNIDLTIKVINPNLVTLTNIIIDDNTYTLRYVSDTEYIVTLPTKDVGYGLVTASISSITATEEGLEKELVQDKSFRYELYTSSNVADINITEFDTVDPNYYLYQDNKIVIGLGNTTSLTPRSIVLNDKEYTSFNYNKEQQQIIIDTPDFKHLDKTITFTLNSMTFNRDDEILIKEYNQSITLDVMALYQKNVDTIEEKEELVGLTPGAKLISLLLVVPILSYIFPFVDHVTINYSLITNIIMIGSLVLASSLTAYALLKPRKDKY